VFVEAREPWLSLLSPKREPSHGPVLRSSRRPSAAPSLRRRYRFHRYYGPLRLLQQPNGPHGLAACARRRALTPAAGDLILYPHDLHAHSAPADPAAMMAGPSVIQASPVCHRVCQYPALIAFAISTQARLRGILIFGAHWMGFTFVADCAPCSPAALHLPSRGRSGRRILS